MNVDFLHQNEDVIARQSMGLACSSVHMYAQTGTQSMDSHKKVSVVGGPPQGRDN